MYCNKIINSINPSNNMLFNLELVQIVPLLSPAFDKTIDDIYRIK